MDATPADQAEERRFHPTSGTAVGWIGLGLAVAAVLAALLERLTVPGTRFALAAALFGALVWCFMLRPRLIIRRVEVELRNALSSWHVPLVAIRSVSVRAVTRIQTDDGIYEGIAVGRPVRSLRHRPDRPARVGIPGLGQTSPPVPQTTPPGARSHLGADEVADFVVERILEASDRARAEDVPAGTPRRTWAWLELAGLSLLAIALVGSFFV